MKGLDLEGRLLVGECIAGEALAAKPEDKADLLRARSLEFGNLLVKLGMRGFRRGMDRAFLKGEGVSKGGAVDSFYLFFIFQLF